MRSGSSAQDGSGWPSAHHPYQNEAVSGPGPYGPGPRSDPHDDLDGRRDLPYGPNISWPNGFRRLDTDSRRLLEAGYGTGDHSAGQFDPRYGAGFAGSAGHAGSRRGYQQPAVDDYGYGDPGYSDPSYDGPRNQFTGPMFALGHQGPRAQGGSPAADGYGPRDTRPSRAGAPAGAQGMYPAGGSGEVYPTTGAQEALPATGPQPIAGFWAGQGPAPAGQGPAPVEQGSRAYPDQRYETPRSGVRVPDGLRHDDPRFDGGRPRLDDPRASGGRPGGAPGAPAAHGADPRLEGIRYDELRYDDPAYDDEPAFGGSRYDQPTDDVSWYEELRRSAPAYPERPNGQPAGGQRRADPPRHGDPRVSSHGQPGYPQGPAREQSSGYGRARDDRGGPGPQMRAGRDLGTGPRPGAGPGRQPALPAAPQPAAFQDSGFREAPTVQVGVLTPPSGARLYAPQEDTMTFVAAPAAGQFLAPEVRPGHGLDGPEITSSWPAQPQTDDLDSFEDFWREDDEDEEYRGLFAGEDHGFGDQRSAASRQAPARRIGRRRGRSNDHRLWLALLGVVIAAAAAITAIIKFEFPAHGGPAHVMVTPAKIGAYQLTPDMARQTNLAKLREEVIEMSAGQASGVKSAVYESGNPAAGGNEQIIMFIGGHLANADPATSITDFTQRFAGATIVSAGSLGGEAACVYDGAKTSNPVSMCVWFDNNSFGELVSPTLDAKALAKAMLTFRPHLELVVKS
jgi:hypothetical protein